MAYCVPNHHHQKMSNGAYLGGHSTTVHTNANSNVSNNVTKTDPTSALQTEMRMLSTKEQHQQQPKQYLSQQQSIHSSYQHSVHHVHQHHHHVHLQTPTQTSAVSGQLPMPPPTHRHVSTSSPTLTSNNLSSSSSSSTGDHHHHSSTATTINNNRTLPRNRRRCANNITQQQPQPGSDRGCGQVMTTNCKRHSFTNSYHLANNGAVKNQLYNDNHQIPRVIRHDSRRGSAGSSLRSSSPSSASSVSSSSSNTRSPSPQTDGPNNDCTRIPSPLNCGLSESQPLTDSSEACVDDSSTSSANANNNGASNHNIAQQVLSYEQVHRLHQVMEQVVPIHGRGNFPTLDIKLKTLVKVVRNKLENAQPPVKVHDIRLNGGAASHVLAPETGGYNDLDLIFGVDLPDQVAYDRVRNAVLDSLLEFLPDGVNRTRLSNTSLKEAYIHKMVKVTEQQDRWSLISLSNNLGRNVELKFVDTMKRQFEFSVDSFHIVLDSLLLFYECSQRPISANIYPTVIGESVYGDFAQALQHLKDKLIATRNPEQIRGGGLLKYCNLLIRGYRPAEPENIKTLERYMCSRFFIDFNEIAQQRAKLESYLANHFIGDDLTRTQYLMQLHKVVDDSTVCLMGYERRQTLSLIEELAYNIYFQMQQQQSQANQSIAAVARAVFPPNNFKHSFLNSHQAQQQQYLQQQPSPQTGQTATLLSPTGAQYEICSDTLYRPGSPSVDSQSNADSTEQESNEVMINAVPVGSEMCTSLNCSCSIQSAAVQHQQFHHPHHHHHHAYLLGSAPSHYYYTTHFQSGYGCYNSCHCGAGGWMTCA